MSILHKDKNFVDFKISSGATGADNFVTWVYGDPDPIKRSQNWDFLMRIGQNRRESWICLGDVNDISNHEEKSIGNRKDQQKIDFFNVWKEEVQMEDLIYQGQMFTWSNNRRRDDRVMERLDWVVANQLWCLYHTSAQ